MKFKTEIISNVSPGNSSNVSIKKKMKANRKSNSDFSPEENLGLKLEKLIEKGVKVKKIDSPEKLKKSPKLPKVELLSKSVTPSKVKITGAGVNSKSRGSFDVTPKTPSTENKTFQTKVANGSSKVKKSKQKECPVSTPISPNRLDLSKVITAVKACLENVKAKDRGKKLIDTPDQLYIILDVVKKCITPSHMSRYYLPHKLVGEDSDVCMIVRNEKGQDCEKTIEHYEELLKENGIKNIKKILTYRQLRTEYSQHELRRKLCNAYDFFIGDGRLATSLLQHLGKHFVASRKIPSYVHVGTNFKSDLDGAFHKTAMKITSHQDSFSCVVGNRSFSVEDIAENIISLTNNIRPDRFPGGWENVRAIKIKTPRSPAFPIYYSCVQPNTVETPVMQPKRPKAAVPVFGEVSTVGGKMVRVDPDGTVRVVKLEGSQQQRTNLEKKGNVKKVDVKEDEDSDDEDEEDEDEDEEDTSDFDTSDDEPAAVISDKSPKQSKAKKNNLQNNVETDESDDDSDNDSDEESEDDIGDKAEQEYLQEIRGELISGDDKVDAEDGDDVEDSDDDDDDDDEDDDDGQQDNIGEEVDNDDSEDEVEDDSDTSESDNSPIPADKNKRKLPFENNKIISPSKKTKTGNVIDQNETIVNSIGKRMFDTSLGETWEIKKKQPARKPENQKGENKKKKSNKKRKLSKSLRKANIKTKGKTKKNKKR